MIFVTHALATTVLVEYAHLTGRDIFFAYIFGVLLDLDHLIKIPLYGRFYHFKLADFFQGKFFIKRGYHWRTPLHEPISLLWIIPLSWFIGSWVPVIFFLFHIFLDYLVSDDEKQPFFPFNQLRIKKLLPTIKDNIKEVAIIFVSLICLIISRH